jgi:hypothetical protein
MAGEAFLYTIRIRERTHTSRALRPMGFAVVLRLIEKVDTLFVGQVHGIQYALMVAITMKCVCGAQ